MLSFQSIKSVMTLFLHRSVKGIEKQPRTVAHGSDTLFVFEHGQPVFLTGKYFPSSPQLAMRTRKPDFIKGKRRDFAIMIFEIKVTNKKDEKRKTPQMEINLVGFGQVLEDYISNAVHL